MSQTATTRRSFAAALAFGLSTAYATARIGAQTSAPLVAVTPEEMVDTLQNTSIRQRYEGVRLEPASWDDVQDDHEDAVGGVKVLAEGNEDPAFGAYVIFEDESAAQNAVSDGERKYADDRVESFPKTIEDYDGVFIEYEDDDEYHSITLISVENTLVIGYDTDVRDHRGRGGQHGRDRHRGDNHQSIGHAAVLVKHLLPILRRQT